MLANRVEEWDKAHYDRGWLKAEQQTLLRLLGRKFGELPGWVQGKVDTATGEQLEQWLDNILFAEKLDDVFQKKAD